MFSESKLETTTFAYIGKLTQEATLSIESDSLNTEKRRW